MRRIGAIAGVLALSLALSGCWLQPGNGAGRTYWNADETTITAGNVENLAQLWDVELGTNVHTPLSNNGTIYVTTGTQVISLNAKTGQENWRAGPFMEPIPGGEQPAVLGPAAFDDGKLYVPFTGFVGGSQQFGGVYTIDAADGDLLNDAGSNTMNRDIAFTGGQPVPLSAISNGSLGLTITSLRGKYQPGLLHSAFANQPPYPGAFAFVGERIVWSLGAEAYVFSAACPPSQIGSSYCGPDHTIVLPGEATGGVSAVGADKAVWGDATGRITVADVTTGAVLWTAEAGSPIAAAISVAGDTILVGTEDGRLVAFPTNGCGAATCGQLWEGPIGSTPTGRVVAAGSVAYVRNATGGIVSFDRAGCGAPSCSPIDTLAANANGSPIVDGGRLVVPTGTTHLTAYAP